MSELAETTAVVNLTDNLSALVEELRLIGELLKLGPTDEPRLGETKVDELLGKTNEACEWAKAIHDALTRL